jgi:hypothetical protein
MTAFQLRAVVLIAVWLAAVALRFRRSRIVLIGGLVAFALFTALAFVRGQVSLAQLGLGHHAWISTLGFAVGGLVVMLAYSPIADALASRLVRTPPTLGAFRALQQSPVRLAIGIVVAWALGGVLEELVFRGVVLNGVEALASGRLVGPAAAVAAICAAAAGAGVIHLYQGPRAALIITQLSVLFGLVFVLSGHDLLAVILCHGLYDTIAFVRFGLGKSKYAKLDQPVSG